MNIPDNSLIQCTVEFLHWVIKVILKLLFRLKLGPYSFTKFLYYNQKDLWLAPFLQMKVFVVTSAGGSFCWNYATDTFYSNYAGANVLLLLCRFWGSVAIMLVILSATLMLVDLFVATMQVTVSVVFMLLQVSAAFTQAKVSATNMWVKIFIEIMQNYFFRSFLKKFVVQKFSGGFFPIKTNFVFLCLVNQSFLRKKNSRI